MLSLSGDSPNWIWSTDFSKNPQLRRYPSSGNEFFHTDRQTNNHNKAYGHISLIILWKRLQGKNDQLINLDENVVFLCRSEWICMIFTRSFPLPCVLYLKKTKKKSTFWRLAMSPSRPWNPSFSLSFLYLPAAAEIKTHTGPRSLPSTSLQSHYSLLVL